ncbi:MAG: hypothetical protein FD167_3824 [bacterium]|nr:MAG: hypothetical protein FD167_3824 [bacterium]
MSYEWDESKAKKNVQKHKIAFAEVIGVLEDERAVTIEEDHEDEIRMVTLGMDFLGRVLVVVYTWRNENIRLISARKATSQERKQYEEENK